MSTITNKDGTEISEKNRGEGISELSSRSEIGSDVAFLWQQCNNTAIVIVVDRHGSETFLLDVCEKDNPLDLFHHRYAYAAHRRIDDGWPAHGQDFRIAA